jgi:probable rRNA maturation factor
MTTYNIVAKNLGARYIVMSRRNVVVLRVIMLVFYTRERSMRLIVNLQNVSDNKNIPKKSDFKKWVKIALPQDLQTVEITIRIVNPEESKALNSYYRGKNKPTNVLSFPFALPEEIDVTLLGDLVICASIVEEEAEQEKILPTMHWAHLVIHGILHLQGYDHHNIKAAKIMEALEKDLLQQVVHHNPAT